MDTDSKSTALKSSLKILDSECTKALGTAKSTRLESACSVSKLFYEFSAFISEVKLFELLLFFYNSSPYYYSLVVDYNTGALLNML